MAVLLQGHKQKTENSTVKTKNLMQRKEHAHWKFTMMPTMTTKSEATPRLPCS